MKIEATSFTHLSFDCYGTLIDWETGILNALTPILCRHGIEVDEATLLRLFARHEAEQEAGTYRPYREVLQGVSAGLARDLDFVPTQEELEALPRSVGTWPPFADTVESLQRLGSRYRLVILSNIDDAMFAQTAKQLQTDFAAVVTAEQVASYKPSPNNFHYALKKLGVDRGRILHVAQSLYHDHVPAKALGLSTVWVNRPSRCPGSSATLPAAAEPDAEVADLAGLVRLLGLAENAGLG